MLTQEQGERLLGIARENIAEFVETGRKISVDLEDYMEDNRGVFVTLRYPDGGLRGCIGIPYPERPLIDALLDSSASATQDPRFRKVEPDEVDDLKIEVTVMTKPVEIEIRDSDDVNSKIEIGKDGLIVKKGQTQGLLLPMVAKEHGFTEKEFLESTCVKAGLDRGSWKKDDVKVLKFQGQVFKE